MNVRQLAYRLRRNSDIEVFLKSDAENSMGRTYKQHEGSQENANYKVKLKIRKQFQTEIIWKDGLENLILMPVLRKSVFQENNR